MRTNKEYKNAALAALKGNWAPALLASVIFIGIVWAVILPYYTVELAAYGLIKMEPLLMLLLLCFSWLGMLLLVRPIGVGRVTLLKKHLRALSKATGVMYGEYFSQDSLFSFGVCCF